MHSFFSKLILLLLLFFFKASVIAQYNPDYSTTSIHQQLKKVNTVGSVLYLAAHPDDENTRLISWLANEACVRTGYLSLTRGDGGQNLIGTEKGALLGVVRTQELLAARRIDGGEQFFTRAVDFGYSKNAEETFSIWNRDEVLEDVVRVIRQFQPDVIVTRFPPTSDAGHGHHTASAILAEEAFALAADPTAYPEQLKTLKVWKTKSLYHNTSTWWYKDLPELAASSEDYLTADIGHYNPILGQAYGEMAAISRSQHRSQGFGSGLQRGSKIEYLKHIKGDKLGKSLFEQLDVSWARYPKMHEVAGLLEKARTEYDPANPAAIVPHLLAARKGIQRSARRQSLNFKVKEIEELILACSGIWLDVLSDAPEYAVQDSVHLSIEAINRSSLDVKIVTLQVGRAMLLEQTTLPFNELFIQKGALKVTRTAGTPYWLDAPFEGMFTVDNPSKIGQADTDAALMAQFQVNISGHSFSVLRPVRYRWVDRADGELHRPIAVLPAISASIKEKVYVFPDDKAKQIQVTIRNHTANGTQGKVELQLPEGWTCSPTIQQVQFTRRDEEQVLLFEVQSTKAAKDGTIGLRFSSSEAEASSNLQTLNSIEYPHIPTQSILLPAQSRIIRLNIQTMGTKIAYIMGAGDEVPQNLEILGYTLELLEPEAIATTDLGQYDAIVAGIRAYNTLKPLAFAQPLLLDYVEQGGTFIVQYNTNRGLVTEDIGPYPMKLSRDRVTREDAEVTFIDSKHPVLNTPNKLTQADFDGWVQERGLYFAGEWDEEKYTALLSWHDPNEEPVNGGLLVCKHGEGAFIYTGISFFRQLPAGVPGAFRLFANLIAAGKTM